MKAQFKNIQWNCFTILSRNIKLPVLVIVNWNYYLSLNFCWCIILIQPSKTLITLKIFRYFHYYFFLSYGKYRINIIVFIKLILLFFCQPKSIILFQLIQFHNHFKKIIKFWLYVTILSMDNFIFVWLLNVKLSVLWTFYYFFFNQIYFSFQTDLLLRSRQLKAECCCFCNENINKRFY